MYFAWQTAVVGELLVRFTHYMSQEHPFTHQSLSSTILDPETSFNSTIQQPLSCQAKPSLSYPTASWASCTCPHHAVARLARFSAAATTSYQSASPLHPDQKALQTTDLLDEFVYPPLGDEHECGGEDGLEELGKETGVEAWMSARHCWR